MTQEIYIFNQIHLIIIFNASINFFLEDQIFKNCEVNSNWAKKTFGEEIYQFLSNKTISCGGTVLANYDAMKTFLILMDSFN